MRKLIKFFSVLVALIIMLIGIALLVLTIFGFFYPSIFVGDTSTKNTVLGIMLGVSIAIIGGCAEGIIGICKENAKMICWFQIIVIIFTAIFIGLGVGLLLLPGILFEGDCANSKNSAIMEISSLYNRSQTTFCLKGGCACNLSNDTNILSETYSRPQIDTILFNFQYAPNGPKTTQDCIPNPTQIESALFSTIGQFQKLLSCSSWCEGSDTYGNLIYRFQDVSTSGKPQNYCYTAVHNAFDNYNFYAKIGTFTAGGILLVMFICNIYICCSRKRKNKTVRDRFMIMEDEQRENNYEYKYRQLDSPEKRDSKDRRDRRR